MSHDTRMKAPGDIFCIECGSGIRETEFCFQTRAGITCEPCYLNEGSDEDESLNS